MNLEELIDKLIDIAQTVTVDEVETNVSAVTVEDSGAVLVTVSNIDPDLMRDYAEAMMREYVLAHKPSSDQAIGITFPVANRPPEARPFA